MWSPTHVQVTVHRARGLISKGKNGTNDAFVTIALGKAKYRTSVKDKSSDIVEWHEECELPIPKQGNTAQIVLTALHRNLIGVADEFLGVVNIHLSDLDVYERPKNRWYKLENKPGKDNSKERGELEVKVAFVVKSGMLEESTKKEKHKASLGQLSHMAQSVGGSLLSIGSLEKRKTLKTFAKSIGHKVVKGKKKLSGKGSCVDESLDEGHDWSPQPVAPTHRQGGQVPGEADPGVISEGESDDDFALDDLSHKSSASSLNASQGPGNQPANALENLAGGEFLRRNSSLPPSKPPRSATLPEKDEWQEKLFGRQSKDHLADSLKRHSWDNPKSITLSQPVEEVGQEELGVDMTPAKASPTKVSPAKASPVKASPAKVEDVIEQPAKKEEEKEKEVSKFARKFKNFRRESKFTDLFTENKSHAEYPDTPSERIIIGGEAKKVSPKPNRRLPAEVLQKYEGKSREDLIEMVMDLQSSLNRQEMRMHDLEDYLDNLLVRVMETTPRILQTPYLTNLKAATWRGFL
ncbi:uncharacterized protein LOC124171933 [Ischnura elegans]|uniref:uncharacterized protein LOC124171933 n=1 Tax=Ischnura elegans TaxID=197161 RepID=UPI001ED88B51|nr:uncharacterized protein LOC124171933 [Ischnura elegans]